MRTIEGAIAPNAPAWLRAWGEHWGTVPPVQCEILTLTLWALHGKIEAKSRWCPRLDGADQPLAVPSTSRDLGGGG